MIGYSRQNERMRSKERIINFIIDVVDKRVSQGGISEWGVEPVEVIIYYSNLPGKSVEKFMWSPIMIKLKELAYIM
jgi:hypothetical protein